jgi:signal transduction histidine kinase
LDIKLKKFSHNRLVEAIAFWLCVVLFLGTLAGGALLYSKASRVVNYTGIDDLLLYDSYGSSAAFQREFGSRLDSILYLLDEYKSEEYIKSGKSLDEDRMDEALREMFYSGGNDYSHAERSYDVNSGETYFLTTGDMVPYDRYQAEYDDMGIKAQFMLDYADQIAALKQQMIMDDLRAFEALQNQLGEIEGFTYLATDGTYTVTNTGGAVTTESALDLSSFEKEPAYLVYKNDDLLKKPVSAEGINDSMKYYDNSLEATLDDHYNTKLTVCFAFDENFLQAKGGEFSEARNDIVKWIPPTVLCGLLALILLIFLIVTTGRKDEEGNPVIRRVDRIFTEVQLLVIGILFVGGGVVFGRFAMQSVNYGVYFNGDVYTVSEPLYLSIALAAAAGLFSAGIGLYFILSVIRNLKTGRFLENSLIFIVVSALWRGLVDFYRGGSMMKKVVLITLAVCLLSATVVLTPAVIALILVFAPKWVKKYEAVKTGVDEVKSGNVNYKIKADGNGELDELARGINQISEASSVAIQNELKNQRLKTDLISNVSHDLKTPLTSIITYVDLLKTEGLDSPDAPKYLEILDQKSIRLKKLTDDLFDAAKASSGAIPVRFERVDMLSLINQGLGEMSDRIEASNLEFRINASQERYFVRADGQLLWRVVENLLNNVLKYAQEGSRVYIDLKEQNGKNGSRPNVVLEIKNISKSELNIDADELMERFKRGDESRTTEGSGLGLAIAKDLVRLQNGWFEIRIDGDLFKAVVVLDADAGENIN